MSDDNTNTAQIVADLVKGLHNPQILDATDGLINAPILLLPRHDGIIATSIKKHLDEYREFPEGRFGTAKLTTLDSLISHTNAFKDRDSVLFADSTPTAPSLTAILDYNEARNRQVGETTAFDPSACPRFGRHRAHHAFPLSDEWKAWRDKNKKPMGQADFAAFIEDRILDILPPPIFDGDLSLADQELLRITNLLKGRFAGPETLMELARGLAVHEGSKVMATVNLASGESSITFESEHRNAEGEKLAVPNLFLLGIQVFESGNPYRVTARLRYRKKDGGIIWLYELYREDRVFKDAFNGAVGAAAAATGLPAYYGTPEA